MKFSVKMKLLLGFLMIIALITGAAIVTINHLLKIRNDAQKAVKEAEVTGLCYNIEISMLEARRAEKNFFIRRDAGYTVKVSEQAGKIREYIKQLRMKKPGAEMDKRLDEIYGLADTYEREFIKSSVRFKSGANTDKLLGPDNPFVTAGRKMQTLVPPIVLDAEKKLSEAVIKSDQTKARAINVILFHEILIIIFGILIALYISGNIVKSTENLIGVMKKVEAGDLSARTDIRSGDELQELGNYFNGMLGNISSAEKERQMLQQQVANAEKLASLGRISAGIAHEINNPLTGILVYTHYVLNKIPKDHPSRPDLEIIAKETARCRGIIKGLLNFARQTKPAIKPSRINEIIEDSLFLMENQPAFRNIKVIKKLDANLPLTEVDPNQIEQVFLNIILNAVEAMPGGGSLSVSNAVRDNFIEVEFVDTGCGIHEENIGKIFDPFFTTKEEGKGTGLGLSVSYGIINKHKGSLEIKSMKGQGTTVIIKLPLKESPGLL